ncbi:MAG: hypothetical protein AAGH64_05585 [Planctomycetota bacterium]
MDAIRRFVDAIRSAFEKLQPTHKLLALSVATVLGMTLFLVAQYNTGPSMVPLMNASYTADEQATAEQYLALNNIPYENGPDGSIMVPVGQQMRAISGLSEDGRLPGDTSLMFRNLIQTHTWTMTSSDKARAYQIALQNELSKALTGWASIRRATVILNIPESRSIGRPAETPTASVSVTPAGDFNQKSADAVAAFVAGAARGLTVERVRVSDTNGRQYRAASDDDMTAGTTQELIALIERQQQSKIYEMLAPYIPGVNVQVTAQVDATRQSTIRNAALNEGQGSASILTSQNRDSSEISGGGNAGGVGARANIQADISTGGSGGSSSNQSTSIAEFDTKIGTEVLNSMDPRGFATKINAVVNIPRDYFAAIWRQEQTRLAAIDDQVEAPAPEADPTDDQISAVRDAEIARIEREIVPLIDTSANTGGQAGEVRVSMIPLPPSSLLAAGAPQSAGFLGLGGGGAGDATVGGVVRTLGLGGLAVLALGLTVFTALKANKTQELPTAEELVGIPKALDADSEIIGEADGGDPPMEGIEVTDEEMHKIRIQEQVGEVVRERPEDSARIIQQWMTEDA